MARLLVENGIDINVRNTGGRTACQIAAERGYDVIVDLLGGRNSTTEGRNRQLAPNTGLEWGSRAKKAKASFGIEAPTSIKYSMHGESSQCVAPLPAPRYRALLILANGESDIGIPLRKSTQTVLCVGF